MASFSRCAALILTEGSSVSGCACGARASAGLVTRGFSAVFMRHLLGLGRRHELPGDDLTERLERLLPCLLGQLLPQLFQRNPLMRQKGGAPMSSVRMWHLLESPHGTAVPSRRVAAELLPILRGRPENGEAVHLYWYCDCFVWRQQLSSTCRS